MNKFALSGIFLLLTSSVSIAEDVPKCRDNGNQLELDACAADAYTAANNELNKVYGRILKEYASEPLFIKKLKVAQRLWLQLRDAEVDARFPVATGENPRDTWGSSYPMDVDYYLAELTHHRTVQLRVWLDGLPEGDLSAGSVRRKK